ncbi:response regulator, partial [bacterium]|nr:response regulator [bacterium]
FATSSGIFAYNYQQNEFELFNEELTATTLFKDSKKNLWIGTDSQGLLKFDGKDYISYSNKNGFTSYFPSCITEDLSGNIWVGTTNSGIFKFDGNKFQNFSHREGLSRENTFLITCDDKNNIWVGTSIGVDKLEQTTNRFIHYGKDSGFLGVETNQNAVCRDSKGNLWFGTIKGLVKYNPKKKTVNLVQPVTKISEVKVFLEKINFSKKSKFSYNQNYFTFDYTSILLTSPEAAKYQYKLAGLDENWLPETSLQSVTYSNLQPGKYIFQVKSCNNDRVWSKPVDYSFIILPPFWQTWWFYLLVSFFIFAVIYLLYKNRIREIEKDNKFLEELIQNKTEKILEQKEKIEIAFSELRQKDELLEKVTEAKKQLLTNTNHVVGINKALEILGKATKVDRVYIFENHPHPETGEIATTQIFEWCSELAEPQIDNPEMTDLPYREAGFLNLYEHLISNKTYKGLTKDFPETEQEVFKSQNILSILIVPIFIENKLFGFIGFDDCHLERIWKPNEEAILFIIANSFGGLFRQISFQKELSDEKEMLSVTLESLDEGVISTDTEGKIILINNFAEMLTGFSAEESVGKNLTEIFITLDKQTKKTLENPVKIILEQDFSKIKFMETEILVTKNGSEKIIEKHCSLIRGNGNQVIGVVIVFRDISEKEKMTEELFKAKKLESVGVLAGGIAHDFNNILTGILGNISFAKYLAKPEDKIFKRLEEAEKASLRAKDLTQQLLTFSKGGSPIKKTESIQDLIKDTTSFVLSGSNVNYESYFPKDLYNVEIDSGQISRVIENLVINSTQAMPNGGTIVLECYNVQINAKNNLPLTEGNYLKIVVKDNGIGIPQEILPKIFDPYFTTKQKGNGLGLAATYSIIQKHEGYITVESKLGVGTTFFIYLPASEKKKTKEQQTKIEHFISGKKILVMDDEEQIREIASQILTELGFKVKCTKNSEETIALYKKEQNAAEPFDLVIMDLTIPGEVGGKETIIKLREINPKIKAIVSSGYSNDPVMANYKEFGFIGFIAKPYRIEELKAVFSKALNSFF